MRHVWVLSIVLAVMLVLVPVTSAQQQPKAKATEAKPQATDPEFAFGTIEVVGYGSTTTITVRVTEMSDNIRRMKGEGGRLTVELPAEILRNNPPLRVGDAVRLGGLIRDGKFVVRNLTLHRGK